MFFQSLLFLRLYPTIFRDSSLTRRVVSLDKELNSTLSLFTQVLACEQALHLGDIVESRRARGDAKAGAARSRVLAWLTSLAQIGELAHRVPGSINGY